MGYAEMDRVLGGGLVPAGSLILIGGEPGIGNPPLRMTKLSGVIAKSVPLRSVTGVGNPLNRCQMSCRSPDITAAERLVLLASIEMDVIAGHPAPFETRPRAFP